MVVFIFILMLIMFMLNFWNKFIFKVQLWMMLMLFYLMFNNIQLMESMIYLDYMFNNISYYMMLLSIWILMLMLMSINNNLMNLKLMILFMLLLLFVLLMFFMSMNMFYMYLWFEISLIPIIIIILIGGSNMNRIYASMYFMLYTLLFSLPLLLVLFYYISFIYSLEFILMIKMNLNIMIFLMLNMAFLVKLPMFLIHIWLPKAHVEAPVFGSMILAAILLKMGSFALYRLLMIFFNLYSKYSLYLIIINLVGGIYMSLVCLMQIDLKMLVAYSSVVHMSLLVSGMLTNSMIGIMGGYLMMLAHGLCSSGLFCLVNIFYERSLSRSILMNKGLSLFMPSLTILWFMMCICNLSSPFSLNLISEILLLNSLVKWNYLLMLMLMLLCFFSSSYSIYMFSISFHGEININMINFDSGNLREYLLIFLHLIPLNLIYLNLMILF